MFKCVEDECNILQLVGFPAVVQQLVSVSASSDPVFEISGCTNYKMFTVTPSISRSVVNLGSARELRAELYAY